MSSAFSLYSSRSLALTYKIDGSERASKSIQIELAGIIGEPPSSHKLGASADIAVAPASSAKSERPWLRVTSGCCHPKLLKSSNEPAQDENSLPEQDSLQTVHPIIH